MCRDNKSEVFNTFCIHVWFQVTPRSSDIAIEFFFLNLACLFNVLFLHIAHNIFIWVYNEEKKNNFYVLLFCAFFHDHVLFFSLQAPSEQPFNFDSYRIVQFLRQPHRFVSETTLSKEKYISKSLIDSSNKLFTTEIYSYFHEDSTPTDVIWY